MTHDEAIRVVERLEKLYRFSTNTLDPPSNMTPTMEDFRLLQEATATLITEIRNYQRKKRKAEVDMAIHEGGKPSFEERYGPWICMGCGYPHKEGDPCPPLKKVEYVDTLIESDDPPECPLCGHVWNERECGKCGYRGENI